MERPKVSIVVVINENNEVLTIRRSKNSNRAGEWESPAGHIEKGESATDAALRETNEETGLKVLLYPKTITIDLRDGGKGVINLARIPSSKQRVKLDPCEHDKAVWVSLKDLEKVKPAPPNWALNIQKILKINGVMESKTMLKSTRKANFPTRVVRVMPGPSADLEEAILVGDEVDIFLQNHSGSKKNSKPDIHGIVERRDRNVIWIRDEESPFTSAIPHEWNDDGKWSFVRVIRGKNNVIEYVNGNPFDPDSNTSQRAKGLGLILDPPKPKSSESVFRIMRGETPDMDISVGQAPKTLEVVAPTGYKNPLFRQIRDILDNYYLEPDMVDDIGNGRVMILTQDPDLKSNIRKVLRNDGTEIKQTKTGALIISRKAYSNNGVQPIQAPSMSGIQNKGVSKFEPKIQMVMPDPNKAIQDIEQAAGSPVQKTPEGMAVTFNDLNKAQQFMSGQTARKGQRRRNEVGRLAAQMRTSLNRGDFETAAKSLTSLRQLGVKISSLTKASLATKDKWQHLHYYLEGKGNISTARVARHLAYTAMVK